MAGRASAAPTGFADQVNQALEAKKAGLFAVTLQGAALQRLKVVPESFGDRCLDVGRAGGARAVALDLRERSYHVAPFLSGSKHSAGRQSRPVRLANRDR